jgi:hypothetical protein
VTPIMLRAGGPLVMATLVARATLTAAIGAAVGLGVMASAVVGPRCRGWPGVAAVLSQRGDCREGKD